MASGFVGIDVIPTLLVKQECASGLRGGVCVLDSDDGINNKVRRLTPVECERLQGFPDNYTNVSYRNHERTPDSLRYKSLGNTMAVPVMSWIGKQIQQASYLLSPHTPLYL